ncbi:MAG: hypothetical protein R3B45_08645 [Bdellovibrionota bacterium]
MSEQWLSIVEYARAYQVSDMTVRRRIRNGKIQAVLRDGKYFIRVSPQPTTETPCFDSADNHIDYPDSTAAGNHQYIGVKRSEIPTTNNNNRVNFPSQRGYPQVETPHIAQNSQNWDQQNYQSIKRFEDSNAQNNQKPTPQTYSSILPKDICNNLSKKEIISMEAQNLLAFCEAMAIRLEKSEKKLRDEFEAKIGEMEAKLKAKDMELSLLKQQCEDLQLLVNIIDTNKP